MLAELVNHIEVSKVEPPKKDSNILEVAKLLIKEYINKFNNGEKC